MGPVVAVRNLSRLAALVLGVVGKLPVRSHRVRSIQALARKSELTIVWQQHTLLETVQLLGVLLPYDCELEKQRLRASPTLLSKRGFPLWWQVAALATCRPVITWNKRSGAVTGHARHITPLRMAERPVRPQCLRLVLLVLLLLDSAALSSSCGSGSLSSAAARIHCANRLGGPSVSGCLS